MFLAVDLDPAVIGSNLMMVVLPEEFLFLAKYRALKMFKQ